MKHPRWLPHPLLSVSIVLTWLLLMNSIAPGQLALGLLFGALLPLLLGRLLISVPRLRRPLVLLRFLRRILRDIVTANLTVAGLILRPNAHLKPGFIEVPLEVCDDFAIAVLASIISLTPGTVSADLSADRRSLLVHVLHLEDRALLIAEIKRRYEQPLREIFGC